MQASLTSEQKRGKITPSGQDPDSLERICRGRNFYFNHASKLPAKAVPGNAGGKGAVLCLLERLAAVFPLCQKLAGDENTPRELA